MAKGFHSQIVHIIRSKVLLLFLADSTFVTVVLWSCGNQVFCGWAEYLRTCYFGESFFEFKVFRIL